MIGTESNRATRRRSGRLKSMAVAGATVAAMGMGLAVAPGANAIAVDVNRDFTWDPVYSSGLVAGLINTVSKLAPGVNAQLTDTISFHTGPPPTLSLAVATSQVIDAVIATIDANVQIGLNLGLQYVPGDTKTLYNTQGGIPQPGCGSSYGISLQGPKGYASTCRYSIQLATLGAVGNLVNMYRGQIASVAGQTPAGLIPFTSAPNSTPTFTGTANGQNGPAYTNQALIFLQNHLRPNGGLAARFPGISNALGIDPNMPAGGATVSPDGKIVLNTTTLDLTWAYDLLADFPAVFNLPAIANSVLGLLPLNVVTGGLAAEPLQGSSLADIGLNLAGVLQLPLNVTVTLGLSGTLYTLPMENGQSFYSTLVPNELPLTAAMGLPGTVANLVLSKLGSKFLLGNPLGDALAPALRIMVNSAYTDVLAPDELDTCATGCGTADAKTWAQLGYESYDRTFGAYAAAGSVRSAATATKFNSVTILSPAEKAQQRADIRAALVAGIKAEMAKPFWGVIVPSSGKSGASVSPATAVTAAQTAAPVQALEAAPVVEAPVEVTSVADPTPSLLNAAPSTGAVRADRGRAGGVSVARKAAVQASTPAGDNDVVKPVSGGKHRASR